MTTTDKPRILTESALWLKEDNAHFHRSAGGLLALTVNEADGTTREYERVIVLRTFPLTSPDELLSVREPRGARAEIGMIRHIGDLDEESEELVHEELAARYFIPQILRVHSVHRRGIIYIDADTDLGRRTMMLQNASSGFRTLDGGRVIITDAEGNNYEIPDPAALDKASYRKIEVFL